ncbi:MAG: hypothetical protein A3C15_02625 [Candidatus Magasanikbacteria bacterium RIFCSPHIGHO2_02_FULL_50_9b]|uniref:CYTH domain-containing protein n=1 Tax=Candidatus Magasanikbacteria bacterium RIFCSPHIGHO2_02_FULL_50_9b TaxID=1798682 RepID=A0A1F6M7R3_9BACT|nr:MAG: hypothetical protein A3C15_02625 [Candidatus Magasanikbacteria bacterium RIFCSPHIGHO2_02_FULL_50_9b]
MIEVEKKFRPSPDELARLLTGAELISRKENNDVFFDTLDFQLSKKWSWLRDRNGSMELKVAVHMPQDGALCQSFTEYEDDALIRAQIGLPASDVPLRNQLIAAGYQPFAELHTERTQYRDGIFHIDVDHTTAHNFVYDVVEIEIMVDENGDIHAAERDIMAFAESRGLKTGHVNGKVLEYIEQKNPAQFQVLVETGYQPES